jgi:hypothetical protein
LSTEKKNKNKTNKQKQKINAKQNQTIDNIWKFELNMYV